MSEQHHTHLALPPGDHSVSHGTVVRRARSASILFVVLLLVGAGITVTVRILHSQTLASTTEQNAHVYVHTIHASGSAAGTAVTLPSTLMGIVEAPIYARSSGYVVRWKKDIGSSVNKDEVLAEIDTPEVDAQLAQAVAARAQQASSLDLAKTSALRWEELRKKDAVTQQDLNERESTYAQAQANLAAADADVLRLKKLESFKAVKAPFAGVIIRRDVEVGDLVDAGNGGAGRALFTLANIHPIRMYVYVPQAYAQRVAIGDPVTVVLTDHPDQPLQATIKHIAGAMDVATRTLQVEINLPNHDGKLLAGSYAQVTLSAKGGSGTLVVPSNVLLFRPEGTRIAVVDAAGKIKLHTVTIGHDLGNTLEILGGITAADNLVMNPGDSINDNDTVVIQADAAVKAHS